MDEVTDCPHCGSVSDTAEFAAEAGHCPVCGKYNEEQDMGQHYAALRLLAAEFVAAQGGVTDRDELAFRAARHADNQTGTWERTAAAQARKLFVAALAAEAPRSRPRRTASAPAVLADFDDQLLFDS